MVIAIGKEKEKYHRRREREATRYRSIQPGRRQRNSGSRWLKSVPAGRAVRVESARTIETFENNKRPLKAPAGGHRRAGRPDETADMFLTSISPRLPFFPNERSALCRFPPFQGLDRKPVKCIDRLGLSLCLLQWK